MKKDDYTFMKDTLDDLRKIFPRGDPRKIVAILREEVRKLGSPEEWEIDDFLIQEGMPID